MYRYFYSFIFFIVSLSFFGQSKSAKIPKIDSTHIYIEKALYFKKNKIFDNALEYAYKAIVYSQKNDKNSRQADAYLTVALLFIDLKKYDQAIENLIRSISLLNNEEVGTKMGIVYYNLGVCYMQIESFSRAESYFEKANSIYESIQLLDATHMVNLEKGILYKEKNQIKTAQEIFEKIVSLPENNKNAFLKAEAYFQLGSIRFSEKSYNMSKDYFEKSYILSLIANKTDQKIKISKKLSEVYDKLSQTKKALQYLKLHVNLKDSLIKDSEAKNQISVNTKIKVDEMSDSIFKLSKENKKQEQARKFSKLINILSIALISILSLLSFSLYKNNLIRNKSNQLLLEKNNELEIAKANIEKASLARSEFLSTVSHELRTPLNAINGISHILLEDKPKPSQIEYLKSLKFSGHYLLTYINEILEINRIESNNIEIEHINFNIRELLHNIKNSLQEQASKNNNNFTLTIHEDVPDILIGDPTKISQIFINLINNALKFTENGQVTVVTSLVNKKNSKCTLKFEVEDTGIGIPNNKLDSIFDSFSQGSVEINRKYGGTGLGLTIVKRLVTLMDGKILVKSEIDKGSTFTFKLKFEIGEEVQIYTSDIINDKILRNKKILLVEDNKINQMITKKILEKKKMVCEISETGENAILKMKSNYYDLVLMDVHLPGINGTVATKIIREFNTTTPIIALTAISLYENREMLLSYGMNDVITKPFDPDFFYKTIETNLIRFPNIA